MTGVAVLLAAVTLGVSGFVGYRLVRGLASLPNLRDSAPLEHSAAPLVSIVVAARDEADQIAEAVNTFLSQDYPSLEVVVVDDRSTDGTGDILDRLAEGAPVRAEDPTATGDTADPADPGAGSPPALRVIHIEELPEGWLGKTHALQRGAEAARGDLLLFTDADIMMRRDAVGRAVGLLERGGWDHLAVAPRIHSRSGWVEAVVGVFLVVFSVFYRPWRTREPDQRAAVGIGAFNLIRSRAYQAIDGHKEIRLRPDDDVRLGRRLKEAGYRQLVAAGRELLTVEWYPSVPAMARGLRKNVFAAVEYRLWLVVAGTLIPLLLIFWPLAALFFTAGLAWWLNLGVVLTGLIVSTYTAASHGLPPWVGLLYPAASVVFLGMVWLAALRATLRGTVEWRGTEYPLAVLRGGEATGAEPGGRGGSGRASADR